MKWHYRSGDEYFQVDLGQAQGQYKAQIDGRQYEIEVVDHQPGIITLRIGGKVYTFYWASEGQKRWVAFEGCTYYLERQTGRATKQRGDPQSEGNLRAPMPAQVRAILVAAGDLVEKGETLLHLEAMKMEIRLAAPYAGRVEKLLVISGETVERDQLLVELQIVNPAKE
jgi:geranyl-CoA carboxylase alpha subunit